MTPSLAPSIFIPYDTSHHMAASSSSSPSGSNISLPDSNVLLAVPDGPIDASSADAKSALVSLIGGYPTFPSAAKAPEEIRCGICHQAIPLLAQVYCPPEGGETDRTVYVWACPRPTCQRRDGSVRAFRASARNEEYARDAEEKRRAAEKAAAEERERARKNPFSMDASAPSLFGSAQPLFGAAASSNPFSASSSEPPDVSKLSLEPASSSSHSLAPPLPAYQPAQYLSTLDEYLPDPEDDDMSVDEDDGQTEEQKQEFRDERWEQLLPGHMDEVFERFVKRLHNADSASNQVLRYELGGVPLPYSSKSPLYQRLFPGAPTKRTPDEDEEPNFAEFYKPSIPPCTRCGGKRVFELQLVPSLISVLRPEAITTTGKPAPKKSAKLTEEERRKELTRIAKGLKGDSTDEKAEVAEMEWGNVLVFGCEADCVGFSEEYVAVEWEAQLSQQGGAKEK